MIRVEYMDGRMEDFPSANYWDVSGDGIANVYRRERVEEEVTTTAAPTLTTAGIFPHDEYVPLASVREWRAIRLIEPEIDPQQIANELKQVKEGLEA